MHWPDIKRPLTTTANIIWSRAGSNRRPPECDSGALPTELLPRKTSSEFRIYALLGTHDSKLSFTERVGFEPTVHMVDTRFPGVPIKPLSHLSKNSQSKEYTVKKTRCSRTLYSLLCTHTQRRGWDSNPRCPEAQRFSRPSD